MNDPFLDWLELWGIWLDELLASGLAGSGQTTRRQIQTWIQTAHTLGYQEEAQAAQALLSEDTPRDRQVTLYYRLLVQQDLLSRLFHARNIQTHLSDT